MIGALKPYAEYRDAEGGWLGRVPAHWTVRRMKYVVREVDHRSSDGKEQLLRVSQYTGVMPRVRSDGLDAADTRAESLVGYKQVKPDDLVINIMLAWNGSMGVSRYNGIASPAYCVYRFAPGMNPWYFHHLLRSPTYKTRIKASSTGVVESRLRLYSEDLGRVEAPVPPPEEQAAIARFLEWANGRLERAIRAKRKVIALLTEQKQALARRAVTRGFDVQVGLKPSGVRWLGDIPQHWSLLPLKSVCEVQSGITLGKDYGGQTPLREYPYLRVANVQADHVDLRVVKSIQVTMEEAARSMLRVGDVLMTEGGDADKLGRGCVWDARIDPCLHQNHVFAVRPDQSRLEPHYLAALMGTSYGRAYFESTAKQTTNLASTNKTKIRMFGVLLPPVEEQRTILARLAEETRPVDTAVSRLVREIDLLRELRTRLVADVVTGKLDVRATAARLPGVATVSEVDETDEGVDAAELDDEATAA